VINYETNYIRLIIKLTYLYIFQAKYMLLINIRIEKVKKLKKNVYTNKHLQGHLLICKNKMHI